MFRWVQRSFRGVSAPLCQKARLFRGKVVLKGRDFVLRIRIGIGLHTNTFITITT